jgi:bifunctional non-homologous end joining protein LigD
MLCKLPFIKPMLATTAKEIPAGDLWRYEVKFDGFRVQIHLDQGDVILFSRNGLDMTRRFRRVLPTLSSFPAKSAILDCELVACDESGQPDFKRLMREGGKCPDLCLWAFDLLAFDGRPLLKKPLAERRALLNDLVNAADTQSLQFSPDFSDGKKLLAQAEKRSLEGVVCKRADSLYASGPTKAWVKVKTESWKTAHACRGEMFNKKVE